MASCRSSRDYLSRSGDDKAVTDAVKALDKKADDSSAANAVPLLYEAALQKHLGNIHSYHSSNVLSRWDKIIAEYSALQKLYETVTQSAAARQLVNARSFADSLEVSKQSAAADYYQAATEKLDQGLRASAKEAYNYYKKADKIIPGYRDSRTKMATAFEAATWNVLVNPITDNSFYYSSGWNNFNNNYINQQFQQNLVRDLGGKDASRYPARFYTDWQISQENIRPDVIVNITLRNLDEPRPSTQNLSQNRMSRVVVGYDTAGHEIYQNVYARLNIVRQSITARIEMSVEITESDTRKTISNRSYTEDYSWQEEHASYSGDERALTDNDWRIINNSRYTEPRQEEVMAELYRRIYPRVKDGIAGAVNW